MSLDLSTSVGEINGLSIIFIDFYVLGLTPRFHQSEAALQFSENITLRSDVYVHVPSAKRSGLIRGVWVVFFAYRLYRVGVRMKPFGTPAYISRAVDISH